MLNLLVRIDKFLKVSRLIKRREIAKELCEDRDVFLNGKAAKPSAEVNAGDTLELHLGLHHLTIKILEVRPFASKEQAAGLYEILSDVVAERPRHETV